MTNSSPTNASSRTSPSDEEIGSIVNKALQGESQRAFGEQIHVPVFRTTQRRSAVTRPRVLVPFSAAMVGVLTVLATGQFRDKPKTTAEVAVESAGARTADDLPRYILAKAGYSPNSYSRRPDGYQLQHSRYFRVTSDGKQYTMSFWFVDGQSTPDPGNTMINGRPTRLQEDKTTWYASQTDGGTQVSIFGGGPVDRRALGKLFDIRLRDDRTLDEATVPNGATVTAQRIEPTYGLEYVRIGNDGDRVRLEVGRTAFSTATDPQQPAATGTKFTRNGRDFFVQTTNSPPGVPEVPLGTRVYWTTPEGVNASLAASRGDTTVDDETLVDLAAAIRPATAKEWSLVLAASGDDRYRPKVLQRTDAVAADGAETPVRFELEATEPGAKCREVLLRWVDDTELEEGTRTCVSGAEAGPFKLLATEKVKGVPVVYGLTSLEGENQVVVVTDAEGYVVGEEVTLDNPTLQLRSYAIGLPDDAVAPFTVELYDFDRAWYVEDPNREPKSYVRPDQEPFATTQLELK